MSKQSNEELIKLIQEGIDTQENYEQLYKQNRGFIYMIAVKRAKGINDIDDMMQQSYIALVKAVELYDESKEETSFLQLLKYCIWNNIRDIEGELPAHMVNKIMKYRRMYDKLYSELGQKPTNDEIYLYMNISYKELEAIKAAMKTQYVISLDEPIGEEGGATRLDLYADQANEEVNFDDNLEKEQLRIILHEAVDKLPEDRKEVINKKYFENLSLAAIGREKGVSGERIRQIEVKALRLLRQDHILRKKAESYVDSYHHVGLSRYKTTWISSTELAVLEREKRLEEWKNQRYKEQLQGMEGFENVF